MSIRKRILSVAAVVVLALACIASFAGCGNEPQNAKDVLARYVTSNPTNYNMQGNLDITMGASGMNMDMDMPIKFNFDSDGGSSHVTYSMSLFGADMDGESYSVEKDGKYLIYSKTNSSGSMFGMPMTPDDSSWTVSETDTRGITDLSKLDESILENATFQKTDSGYLVSIKGSDLYAYYQKNSAGSEDAASSALSQFPQEYIDFINGLSVDCTFDKDCKLTNVAIPETKSSLTTNGQAVDFSIACNVAIGNYGNVSKIVVPDDVVNTAKPAETSDKTSSGFGTTS